jgi:thiol:disulfide interchange protein DsbC
MPKLQALTKACLLLVLLIFAGRAAADEASVKKAAQAKFPQSNIESVTKTPYFGLYEVYIDRELFYTDDKLDYFILGSIFDGKTLQNLSEERKRKLSAIKFDSLPLDLAIKIVKGNGKRKVAIFFRPVLSLLPEAGTGHGQCHRRDDLHFSLSDRIPASRCDGKSQGDMVLV